MNSAIAATGKNRVASPAHGLLGQHTGAAGCVGFQRFGFNARLESALSMTVRRPPEFWPEAGL
jgi:hypothetical protein